MSANGDWREAAERLEVLPDPDIASPGESAEPRDVRNRATSGRDILGGPDGEGREDITGPLDQEPGPGEDILGGSDGLGREDIMGPLDQEPGPGEDILGGSDGPGHEDIMGPPDEEA